MTSYLAGPLRTQLHLGGAKLVYGPLVVSPPTRSGPAVVVPIVMTVNGVRVRFVMAILHVARALAFAAAAGPAAAGEASLLRTQVARLRTAFTAASTQLPTVSG